MDPKPKFGGIFVCLQLDHAAKLIKRGWCSHVECLGSLKWLKVKFAF